MFIIHYAPQIQDHRCMVGQSQVSFVEQRPKGPFILYIIWHVLYCNAGSEYNVYGGCWTHQWPETSAVWCELIMHLLLMSGCNYTPVKTCERENRCKFLRSLLQNCEPGILASLVCLLSYISGEDSPATTASIYLSLHEKISMVHLLL